MYLKYKSYTHTAGETELSISRETLYSEHDEPWAVRERWDILGRLQITDKGTVAANQTAMTTAINALKTAYASGSGDLVFYDDSGAATSHSMLTASAVAGVKVVAPMSFPEGRGAEYSTFRNYTVSLEATFLDSSAGLISWTESISYRGTGGSEFVYLVPRQGNPQQQWPTQRTPIMVQQQGAATGANGIYPVPPAPIFGLNAEHVSQRDIRREVPQDSSRRRQITWSFVFEVLVPGTLFPTTKSING